MRCKSMCKAKGSWKGPPEKVKALFAPHASNLYFIAMCTTHSGGKMGGPPSKPLYDPLIDSAQVP